MKKLTLLFLPLTILFAIASCKKEGCTDPKAVNYDAEAKKDDGTCVQPKPDERLAVKGYYITKDSTFADGEFNGNNTYSLHVYFKETDPEKDRIYLNGIWGSDKEVYASYSGSVFVIPTQAIEEGYSITGSGQIFGNKILYKTEGTNSGVYIEHKGEGNR